MVDSNPKGKQVFDLGTLKSRHRALGDYKRTRRVTKTASVAQPCELSRIPVRSRRGGCQNDLLDSECYD